MMCSETRHSPFRATPCAPQMAAFLYRADRGSFEWVVPQGEAAARVIAKSGWRARVRDWAAQAAPGAVAVLPLGAGLDRRAGLHLTRLGGPEGDVLGALVMGAAQGGADQAPNAYVQLSLDRTSILGHVYGVNGVERLREIVIDRVLRAAPAGAVICAPDPFDIGVSLAATDEADLARIAHDLQNTVAEAEAATDAGPAFISVCAAAMFSMAPERFAAADAALARTPHPQGFAMLDIATEAVPAPDWAAAAHVIVDALAEDRVTIAYQPVVRADRTSMVSFYESLVRVVGKDGGLINAAEIMPAAEGLGLVRLIDRRMLDLAFQALDESPGARLSVNCSPQTVKDDGWRKAFQRQAAERPDLCARLIVEITESAAIQDPDLTGAFIEMLAASGAAVALDDFGAGYTSFRHLRDYRFDIVKIDGAFIRGLADNRDDQMLVRHLVEIAGHYEMMTVAEFVPDARTGEILREMGVDAFQGFYYGRPEVNPDWRAYTVVDAMEA